MPFWRSRHGRSWMFAAGTVGALTASIVAASASSAAVTGVAPVAGVSTAPTPLQLTLPAPTGHHQIGTVALHLVDPTRQDPWVLDQPERELMISIWYPAATTAGYPAAPWLEPAAAAQFFADQHVPAGAVTVPLTAGHIGAPVDRRHGPHPVVLYSPGLQADRSISTLLVEELASEGYVVVTIDHTHDAAEVEFPGQRVELSTLPSDNVDVVTKAVEVRAADTRFVLDQLAAVQRGANPDAEHARLPVGLAGSLDLARTGMFGWSDGGATVGLAMHDDARIRAGVSMDGSFYGALPAEGLDRPLMLMSSQDHNRDNDTSWATIWGNLRGGKLDLRLVGTQHLSFTDEEFLIPQVAKLLNLTNVPDGIGTLAPDRVLTIERLYLTAFFDQHLRHRPSPLLAKPSPRFPEVQFVP